ncbi:MAG TPA: RNA-binding protein [Myxococcota bacterium]
MNAGQEIDRMKKIYVGNLPWSATDASLREAFSSCGEVQSASVVIDRDTGRSRGFGFVEMDGPDADKAIRELDGRDLDGRAIRVNEARPKTSGRGDRW